MFKDRVFPINLINLNILQWKTLSFSQLSQALKKGRKPLEIIVENSLYRRATGMKVKTQTRRFIERPCDCDGDENCPYCNGYGKITTNEETVQETVTELPPDTGAAAFWLKQKKPEIWNKQPDRTEITGNIKGSISVDEWIKQRFDGE